MALKEDLVKEVTQIFVEKWTERAGTVVPHDGSVQLRNDGVTIEGTVLYADLADSTAMVDRYSPHFAAEIYKAYLTCCAKVLKALGGTITAYDGDRVMAVFIGDNKNTAACKAALKINGAIVEVLRPLQKLQYPKVGYVLDSRIGIDTSPLFVAKTGVRGANDLVWVGRAANHAAKMAALPGAPITISKDVYDVINNEAKISSAGQNMWTAWDWEGRAIYRSNYHWKL